SAPHQRDVGQGRATRFARPGIPRARRPEGPVLPSPSPVAAAGRWETREEQGGSSIAEAPRRTHAADEGEPPPADRPATTAGTGRPPAARQPGAPLRAPVLGARPR